MHMLTLLLLFAVQLPAAGVSGQALHPADAAVTTTPAVPKIADKVAGLQKIDGFMPLYWDDRSGKLWMEIGRFGEDILYQVSLPAGVGSNAIGLDRGQMGETAVVVFQRVGPKVLMVQPNYRYRATTGDAAERRAVDESFARSVLWGFTVEATEGSRVLVDATAFFLRDAHGVIDRLRQARQGHYRADASRSALYLPRTKGFPKNTEVEATLTFTTDEDPGRLVGQVTPTPAAVTVREHHSFFELPPLDGSYKPRRHDARVSSFAVEFNDYSTPITAPIEQRWISRHRLIKKDPSASVSDPVTPIVYYVDNGAPEPIRSALVEGASWWSEAFEAAGFSHAFIVKVLPDDADPMDLRYNMINWVHRSSRGWSYGGSVVDPRTGEILKGNVTLGSLRIRQDYLLGSGLVPQDLDGAGAPDVPDMHADHFACDFGALPELDYLAALDPHSDAAALSLARVRQLSAHETGHTLGFAHNFAASTYGRASVMDYPAPAVGITNGHLDLSNAYGRGIGAFDKFAVTYAYAQFPPGADEERELQKIVASGVAAGMLFISDEDARPPGAAHPLASLWDDGADPIASLRHEMEVRRIGLSQFGLGNIPDGTPLSMLEASFLPLYLHHRYQLQATVKTLGGLSYTYAVKTAGKPLPTPVAEIVPAARQREALKAVLDTIKVDELVIPARILDLIPPRAFGYGGPPAELFEKRTNVVFDPVAPAAIAADMTVSALLQPERAARLDEFHARNAANPSFDEVARALLGQTWYTPAPERPGDGPARAVLQAVQDLVVTRLMDLASNADAALSVRATAAGRLRDLRDAVKPTAAETAAAGRGMPADHLAATRENIERFLTRPDVPNTRTVPLPAPPGDPIGGRIR
jgi:Met-zincin/Domain of unknown function (DUF5117)